MTPEQLQQRLERLYGLQNLGIKFGLETELDILKRMGNPQDSFASVHVAGTNGKGSVCAMVESVLRSCGLGPVGLYTSPHLVRFNERVRVSGTAVTDQELGDLVELAEQAAKATSEAPGGRVATFFEITTAMAFEHIRRQHARLAVVETGMGGRLDATNVVTPLVSVITAISLEHMAYLGDDLASIAGEKAGIIKEGRPVICARMPEEAAAVVERIARERKAPCVVATDTVSVRRVSQSLAGQKVKIESGAGDYGTALLPLLGRHQLENCATAVAALEIVMEELGRDLDPSTVQAGLAATRWPGRLHVLSEDPVMILDGAHNPGAGQALSATLKELIKRRPLGLVLGMCRDKDAAGFVKQFAGMTKKCWVVPLRTERSLPTQELGEIVRRVGLEAEPVGLSEGLQAAEAWARREGGAVCIAGSLFLVGEVLELKGIEV